MQGARGLVTLPLLRYLKLHKRHNLRYCRLLRYEGEGFAICGEREDFAICGEREDFAICCERGFAICGEKEDFEICGETEDFVICGERGFAIYGERTQKMTMRRLQVVLCCCFFAGLAKRAAAQTGLGKQRLFFSYFPSKTILLF